MGSGKGAASHLSSFQGWGISRHWGIYSGTLPYGQDEYAGMLDHFDGDEDKSSSGHPPGAGEDDGGATAEVPEGQDGDGADVPPLPALQLSKRPKKTQRLQNNTSA